VKHNSESSNRGDKRLSLLSSGEEPWLSVPQDGVEDDEELAHAGGHVPHPVLWTRLKMPQKAFMLE
jgi:hypothetical protein